MNISKIGNSAIVEDVIKDLQERADDTEELVVLRAYRNEAGEKCLEWWTSRIESRIWVIGALNYLAYKMQGDSEGWE